MENQVAVTGAAGAVGAVGADSCFFDMQRFSDAQRVATMLATSDLIPDHFRGKVANCVIALDLAARMRVNPFMLMQNLYVVHGRPGIEGKLGIALIEGSGRFTALKFRMDGQGVTDRKVPRADSCVAYATEIKTGEVIEGPAVTWAMADAEGWLKPKKDQPSKWHTMPDLMFRYRAAMFFARVNCPGALLGLRSQDELEDIEMVRVGEGTTSYSLKKDPPPAAPDLSVAVAEFDLATKEKPFMGEYLEKAVTHFKKTLDVIKAEASRDIPAFLAAYEKWADGKITAVAPCPNAPDVTYNKAHCDKCATRTGCPSWAA